MNQKGFGSIAMIGGLIGAMWLFKQMKSNTGDDIGMAQTASPAITGTGATITTSAPSLANPSVPAALKMVQNRSTSSPSELAAQWKASASGQSYSGVSGGVVYKVSGPVAPSAGQRQAIIDAGYGSILKGK